MSNANSCWTCGGTPHVSGLVCVCSGTGSHNDEVAGLRDIAAKYNYCQELLRDLKKYVSGSLPTHLARGGEADRQDIMRRLNKVLGE